MDLINANKAAKIFDSKSLTLKFKVKHFGRFISVKPANVLSEGLAGSKIKRYSFFV